jgi:hypothetical protein
MNTYHNRYDTMTHRYDTMTHWYDLRHIFDFERLPQAQISTVIWQKPKTKNWIAINTSLWKSRFWKSCHVSIKQKSARKSRATALQVRPTVRLTVPPYSMATGGRHQISKTSQVLHVGFYTSRASWHSSTRLLVIRRHRDFRPRDFLLLLSFT